jgi:hypothetical protein
VGRFGLDVRLIASAKAVMAAEEVYHHRTLPSGIEFAALEIPGRRTAGYEIRLFAGMAHGRMIRAAARVVETRLPRAPRPRPRNGYRRI